MKTLTISDVEGNLVPVRSSPDSAVLNLSPELDEQLMCVTPLSSEDNISDGFRSVSPSTEEEQGITAHDVEVEIALAQQAVILARLPESRRWASESKGRESESKYWSAMPQFISAAKPPVAPRPVRRSHSPLDLADLIRTPSPPAAGTERF